MKSDWEGVRLGQYYLSHPGGLRAAGWEGIVTTCFITRSGPLGSERKELVQSQPAGGAAS